MNTVHPPSVLAVIVLYRRNACQSEAYVSLQSLLLNHQSKSKVDVVICDNSPQEQSPPAEFNGTYLRDAANPGLAVSYANALKVARDRGAEWLMLLDQDTTLTRPYLDEVMLCLSTLASEDGVAAFVPVLSDRGLICSPVHPPVFGPARGLGSGAHGVCPEMVHAFNSGAVLRVSAIERMGGFPAAFPLDYLDHATFFLLQKTGGRVFLLRSMLEHRLSSNQEPLGDAEAILRVESMLSAERKFYREYGSHTDRLLRRFRLFRTVVARTLRGKEKSQTWRILKAALLP